MLPARVMSIRAFVTASSLVGLVSAVAACSAPSDDAGVAGGEDDLTSAFEIQVGGPGDAEVGTITELADQSILATFHFPQGVAKYTSKGVRDPAYKSPGVSDAWRVWATSDGYVLAPSEQPDKNTSGLRRITRFRASDGALDPGFGTNGVVTFADVPNVDVFDAAPGLVSEYDRDRGVVIVVLVREWQMVGGGGGTIPQPGAPRTIEVIEVDAKTGAQTSKGTHTFPDWKPPWSRADSLDFKQVDFRGVYAEADGSYLLVTSETVFRNIKLADNPPTYQNDIETEWSTIRLVAGAAPTRTVFAETEYDDPMLASRKRADGSLDVVLGAALHVVGGGHADPKMIRFAIDPSGSPAGSKTLDTVPESQAPSPLFSMKCTAFTTDGDDFVVAQTTSTGITFTRYPLTGAGGQTTVNSPSRCVRAVSYGASGSIYLGAWDTSGVGWRAVLTKIAR